MSKNLRKGKKKLGAIVASVGVGIVLTVAVPFWGWITVGGIALIYCGWHLMNHHPR